MPATLPRMSGSINPGLLFAAASGADLIATLYGQGTSAQGAGGAQAGGDPLLALTLAEKNQARDVAAEAKDPVVSRDIAAFQKGVAQAKTIQDALTNPNVLKVLLTANGLSSLQDQQALVRKALLSDPTDPASLVSRLGNTQLLAMAKTFRFDTNGLAALTGAATQATLSGGYAEVMWRKSLDTTTPGLSYALDFRARAASFTSADKILGDPTGWEVVLNALGIPQQIAFQDLPAQEKAITTHLDVARLQDPHFVDGLVQQYLLAKQSSAQPGGTSLDALAVQSAGLVV